MQEIDVNTLWRNPLTRLLLLLVVLAALLTNGCSPSHLKDGPRIRSTSQLHTIGLALRDYQHDHGKLPERLSELVPRYIGTNSLATFYVTNRFTQEHVLPPNWTKDPSVIDGHASYVYLGTNIIHGVVAFEKTNLWRASAHHADKVATLFSDFSVVDVLVTELQGSLLAAGAKQP